MLVWHYILFLVLQKYRDFEEKSRSKKGAAPQKHPSRPGNFQKLRAFRIFSRPEKKVTPEKPATARCLLAFDPADRGNGKPHLSFRMLQTEDLAYSYDHKKELTFPDIQCQTGEHWLLLGQSGSGKTTLLHLLGGLLSPSRGQVWVSETGLTGLSSHALDQFRGRNIGIIFQKSHFVRSLTVEENLVLAQQLAGLKPDRLRIAELLDHLNVGHKLQERPQALSVGEQQRVAIARALVNRPAVILADEPTSALDDVNCMEVINLIEREANEEGATLLVVTHDNRLKERFENQILLT